MPNDNDNVMVINIIVISIIANEWFARALLRCRWQNQVPRDAAWGDRGARTGTVPYTQWRLGLHLWRQLKRDLKGLSSWFTADEVVSYATSLPLHTHTR